MGRGGHLAFKAQGAPGRQGFWARRPAVPPGVGESLDRPCSLRWPVDHDVEHQGGRHRAFQSRCRWRCIPRVDERLTVDVGVTSFIPDRRLSRVVDDDRVAAREQPRSRTAARDDIPPVWPNGCVAAPGLSFEPNDAASHGGAIPIPNGSLHRHTAVGATPRGTHARQQQEARGTPTCDASWIHGDEATGFQSMLKLWPSETSPR